MVIEPLLLTAARIDTFDGPRPLTSASGFFFARDDRLYLVTSRHVLENLHAKNMSFGEDRLPPGEAWLLVEFGADTQEEADDRARELQAALERRPHPPAIRVWRATERGDGACPIPGR